MCLPTMQLTSQTSRPDN